MSDGLVAAPGKFRKKPVVVDAAPIVRLLNDAAHAWDDLPEWVVAAYERGMLVFTPGCIHVHTLEGIMLGLETDWLVRGTEGEFYPVKPAAFARTFEAVEG